jgi:hypothetical protein
MERDRGIEPLSTAWKAEAQASIPIPLRLFQILKHEKNILSSIFFVEIYSLVSEYYRRFFSCCNESRAGLEPTQQPPSAWRYHSVFGIQADT